MILTEAWHQTVATLIEAANSGADDIASRFAALKASQGAEDHQELRTVANWVFVGLVNARHYALAAKFGAAEGLRGRIAAAATATAPDLSPSEESVLFCLSVLDLQPGGDPERGLANFMLLQRLVPPDHHLYQVAQDGTDLALSRLGRQVSIDWRPSPDPQPEDMRCPTCLDCRPKSVVLSVAGQFPGRHASSLLLRCAACTCLFFNNIGEMQYEVDGDIHGAALAFYVQLAAGIETITRSIAKSGRPAGSSFLDIGCGYGFGLDYALQIKEWKGRGMDPSSLARAGAAQLNLPITSNYFTADDTQAPADVAMVSEVLEHVANPRDFIALLRKAIVPGGLLILSTPNADAIKPETDLSILIPALSVGAHIVLQTAESLTTLLHEAGLAHVIIEPHPHTLTAFASDRPIALNSDAAAIEAEYGAYLEWRVSRTTIGTDLWLGFAARAFQRASLGGDYATADAHYAALLSAIRDRFGFDLDNPADIPDLSEHLTPETLMETAPFCVANLLYVRALQLKAIGEPTERLWPRFAVAAATARHIRPALRQMNADAYSVADVEHESARQAARLASTVGAAAALDWLKFISAEPGCDAASLNQLSREIVSNLVRNRAWWSALRGYLTLRFANGRRR